MGQDKNAKTYYIHESLLREKSAYFNDCLSGSSAESQADFFMPEESPKTLVYFVEFLYRGEVNIQDGSEVIVEIYQLASELLCPGLKDQAVDALRFSQWYFFPLTPTESGENSVRLILKLYNYGLSDSKMMSFLIEDLATQMRTRGYEKATEAANWNELLSLGAPIVTRVAS